MCAPPSAAKESIRRCSAKSVLVYSVVNMLWVFSCLLVPVYVLHLLTLMYTGAAANWFTYGCGLVLISYYSYRAVQPRRRWPLIKNFFVTNTHTHPYFEKQDLVFDEGVTPIKEHDSNMLCFHPHGVLSCGWSVNGSNHKDLAESNITWLVASSLFKTPIFSDVLVWNNYGPAEKKYMNKKMAAKRNLALIPGGFEEATVYAKDKHRVFIKNRMGFVKYALQHGYKLFPVYTFGEEQTFWAFKYFLKLRMKLNKHQIPGVIFSGLYGLFFLPYNDAELTTVIGKPIQCPKIDNPSRQDVALYHGKYVQALESLFEKHRKKYAKDPEAVLELF